MKKPYIKDRRGEERHTALKRDPIGVGVGAGKADRARRRGGARQRAERRRAESAQREPPARLPKLPLTATTTATNPHYGS